MKWLAGALIGTLTFCAAASAAPSHVLKPFEARSAAESVAFSFERAHKLDSEKVGRCKRRTQLRFVCSAAASGETERTTTRCQLTIAVRAVYRGYSYWDTVAGITKHRCSEETLPFLTYEQALPAIQSAADAFAGTKTAITSMQREDAVTYRGRGEWTRPRTPPNEYLPTEDCSVTVVATLAGDTVATRTEDFSCF